MKILEGLHVEYIKIAVYSKGCEVRAKTKEYYHIEVNAFWIVKKEKRNVEKFFNGGFKCYCVF